MELTVIASLNVSIAVMGRILEKCGIGYNIRHFSLKYNLIVLKA
jgi:hypothetical protein